ncbi:transposase [archaeon]|jgi:transposase|nr:transposase [archaeon]
MKKLEIKDFRKWLRIIRGRKPTLFLEYTTKLISYREPRKQYPQKWNKYDEAKTNEDQLFKRILIELLEKAIENQQPTRGRRPIDKRTRIFCMCMKVYYRSDLRKCTSLLKEWKRLNYIDKAPCFKSIDNFFNDESMSDVLDDLILITALPLAKFEDTCGMDGTGFSLSRFDRWNNYKWGRHKGKQRVWRKAHLFAGCKSNIIIGVEVTEKNVPDIKMVEQVIGQKPLFFEMQNFVADKAYSSRRVLGFIKELNMAPYIPFKKNVSSKSKGYTIWNKMFKLFKEKPQEFMPIYNARSNLESSIHMVKQRFGDNLNTKKLKANVNEIKIKVLCHNICCLIVELFERRISIDFEDCVKKTQLCNK